MNFAKTLAQQGSASAIMTRRYLYALLALNLAILALTVGFFWYHQQVQDRIFYRIVNYHGAVARAAQASLTELDYISDELWRQASLSENPDIPASPTGLTLEIMRSHISALSEQKRIISSIQDELREAGFEAPTSSALQAFDPVLRIGTEEYPGRQNLSARLEPIDELGGRLRNLLALHLAEQDRLTLSGPHSGLNHPEFLMLAIGFLTVFGLAAGFGVIRSVTTANMERETAFSALVKSERELAHLADGLEAAQRIARVGNWDWDRETGAEWWSDENYRIIGLEPRTAPATNETFFGTIHAQDRAKVAGLQEEAERNACPYQIDFRVTLADGEIRYIREIGVPIFNADGNFTGQRGTIQDISEQYLAEDRLAETVRRLEAAQRIANVADWEWNPESGILTWPSQMWKVLGLPPSDEPISNDSFAAMLHPDDREPLLERMRQAVDAKEPYTMEYRYLAPSGEAKVIMEHGEPFVERDTGKIWLRGTVQDITEQKATEKKLSNAVTELNKAQRLARVGSWTWDIVSNKDSWSDECYRIHGLQPGTKELTGSDYLSYVHPDDRDTVQQAHDYAIASGEPLDIEFRLASADGIERIVRTHGEVSYDETGRPVRMTGTVQDVSELRRRERELRDIQERFSLAFQLSPSATAISEIATGIHVDVNDKWVEILGHSRDEAIGRTAAEMGIWANPEDRARAIELLNRDGRFRDFEAQYRTRSGELRDFVISAEPFPIGDKPHMLIVGHDITDRKTMERELRESADRLEKSQKIGKIGSWVWDFDADREWWSDEVYRMFGMKVGEIVPAGFDFIDYVHPDDREATRTGLEKAIREGIPFSREYRICRPDGSEIVLFEQSEVECDADGRPVRLRGTAQDITERKKAEMALLETKERLEEAQRLGHMGSWTWDQVEDVEWWSEEQYRMFGLEPGSIILDGWGFLQYVHPEDINRVNKVMRRAVDANTPFKLEYRIIRPDGAERVVSEQAEPLSDHAAGKPFWRGVTLDITERKHIEQELARLNAELEQRVEERTTELRAAQDELVKRERLATLGQLTATVSHELRNPLGAIRTSIYVVEKITPQVDPRAAEAIRRINRNITRCDNIIDELLDYTRMRDMQIQKLSVDNWLAAVLAEQETPSGISVQADFNIGNLKVSADPDRLRRAVINLFENACQAMAPNGEAEGVVNGGTHQLTVSTRQREDRAEIVFEDTGPGISDKALDRIFEPLFSTKNFGVGLGLPIVLQIMEQHGGGVVAANGEKGGARFVLWLPLAAEKKIDGKVPPIETDSRVV